MDITDETIKKIIGAQLKELRISKGFSQKELSELLGKGTSQTLINFYEKGEREIKGTTIVKLAKILEVSPNVILGFEEDKVLAEVEKNKEFLTLIKDDPKRQLKKIVNLWKSIEQLYQR